LIVALVSSVASCGRSPSAPTDEPPTISGHVYQTATSGFGTPSLSRVLIIIEQTDGSQRSTLTNDAGFYSLSATAGLIAISAMKDGYETSRSRFDLSFDTVLNFSLTRDL
jgi:hypothetical protein